MITTEDLRDWEAEIEHTQKRALALAKKHKDNKDMRKFYTHVAQTAEVQLSVVHRLIRQSEAQEETK